MSLALLTLILQNEWDHEELVLTNSKLAKLPTTYKLAIKLTSNSTHGPNHFVIFKAIPLYDMSSCGCGTFPTKRTGCRLSPHRTYIYIIPYSPKYLYLYTSSTNHKQQDGSNETNTKQPAGCSTVYKSPCCMH